MVYSVDTCFFTSHVEWWVYSVDTCFFTSHVEWWVYSVDTVSMPLLSLVVEGVAVYSLVRLFPLALIRSSVIVVQ